MDDLIGSAEAASVLGKSRRSVHRLVDDKKLKPAMTVSGGRNGAYLFHRSDVIALKPTAELPAAS